MKKRVMKFFRSGKTTAMVMGRRIVDVKAYIEFKGNGTFGVLPLTRSAAQRMARERGMEAKFFETAKEAALTS